MKMDTMFGSQVENTANYFRVAADTQPGDPYHHRQAAYLRNDISVCISMTYTLARFLYKNLS